ncbi:two-component system, response regulator YesN [Paenibacillus sp. 1_12]|uniref:response regulator transcription factor n=1 Tax=Paenibacillus sp. 1_12 TaxID=1566278 RepID=UPI0008E21DAD|nr:response regulator [Paenibacillus sp. 1_12]SFK80888.1 two-component system, response regulator YesN [Paenibacillus sp. 1_12]
MLKVMLVDDDVPMMKYLKKLVSWSDLGMEITAMANSGKKALQLFRETNPDLVITDIGMPQMDGLELAAELKRIKPEIRLFFLTCHEEFHYARKAVQLDADDYLIKDELTREQLEEALQKAALEMKELLKQLGEQSYKQDLIKNKDVLKERFFQQVMSESSAEETLNFGKRLGFEWGGSQFLVSVGYLNFSSFPEDYRYSDVSLLLYAISNIAQELSVGSIETTTFTDSESYFICIANYQPNLSLNTVEMFHQYLDLLKDRVKQFLKIDISIMVEQPVKGVESIKWEVKKLKQLNGNAFYNDNSSGTTPALGADFWSVDVTSAIGNEWNKIVQAFKDKDKKSIVQALKVMKDKARKQLLEPRELVAKCSQWVRVLELEGNHKSDDSFHHFLMKCKRLDEALLLLEKKMNQLYEAKEHVVYDRKPKLLQIDQYIAEHITDNISLVDIADYLFLNPSYLSRYFKQETGMNLTDYVHRYKMKIACHMLKNHHENIELVAFKLGYLERTYFSKVFKKYVGVSPKDYR